MRHFSVLSLCLLAAACFGSPLPSQAPGDLAQRTVQKDGVNYPFVVFVPTTSSAGTALPAMLLVHGAGGNGPDFLATWQSFAESHGIILVAPTLDLSAAAEVNVPVVFPAIMDAVRREWSVDASRLYVFGYSAGGYFAFDAALLNSTYFAAAGIFASVIQPEYDGVAKQAVRRTGIAMYMGDRDQYFTLAQARRTRDLLQANGVDVRYVELPNQGHDYLTASAYVNADAWAFMSGHRIP